MKKFSDLYVHLFRIAFYLENLFISSFMTLWNKLNTNAKSFPKFYICVICTIQFYNLKNIFQKDWFVVPNGIFLFFKVETIRELKIYLLLCCCCCCALRSAASNMASLAFGRWDNLLLLSPPNNLPALDSNVGIGVCWVGCWDDDDCWSLWEITVGVHSPPPFYIVIISI